MYAVLWRITATRIDNGGFESDDGETVDIIAVHEYSANAIFKTKKAAGKYRDEMAALFSDEVYVVEKLNTVS